MLQRSTYYTEQERLLMLDKVYVVFQFIVRETKGTSDN